MTPIASATSSQLQSSGAYAPRRDTDLTSRGSEIDAAAIGTKHLHHRRRIVEHKEPVPPDEHPVEEQHAVLLVEHLQWMAPRPEPARHRLARQDLEPG